MEEAERKKGNYSSPRTGLGLTSREGRVAAQTPSQVSSGPTFSESVSRLQGPNVWPVQTDVRKSGFYTSEHGYLQKLDWTMMSEAGFFPPRDTSIGSDFPQIYDGRESLSERGCLT